MSAALEALIAVFQTWLYLPDVRPLLAVLGTVAANRLDGDPVWLLVVGPPGGGKSELIGSLSGLADVYPAATLTEAALLSGTPKREKEQNAKGGLLRVIGDFGIVVCKDFGSVLSMNSDGRAQVLAALREVYDGSWTRHVGTGGGLTLSWSGKVGLIAGCTPTVDRHHAVMGAMGERFVLFRLPDAAEADHARRSIAHAGRETEMRRELAAAVTALFDAGLVEPQPLSEDDTERLVSLAVLVARCRSAVERDGYTREIELIPQPEVPTRLVVVLARLLAGLDAVGADRPTAWPVVVKAALDSVPAIRRDVINVLFDCDGAMNTTQVSEAVQYPNTTTKRALEDLTAHGITDRRSGGEGKAHFWSLSEFARTRYAAATTAPETPQHTSPSSFSSSLRIEEVKTGEVGLQRENDSSSFTAAVQSENHSAPRSNSDQWVGGTANAGFDVAAEDDEWWARVARDLQADGGAS